MRLPTPTLWTIAGSDSGSGAGIQADLLTCHDLGVHACTVITALTAQNSVAVNQIECASATMVRAQMETLLTDLAPKVIKLGMLGSMDIMQELERFLSAHPDIPVVCDPVMVTSSGSELFPRTALDYFMKRLLPRTDLLTPNIHEAETLTGQVIKSTEDMEAAGKRLCQYGAKNVLVKGGDIYPPSDLQPPPPTRGRGILSKLDKLPLPPTRGGAEGEGRMPYNKLSQDFWTNGKQSLWLTGPRHTHPHNHGSGCSLASAIAACLALDYTLLDALVIAKSYVSQGIRLAQPYGAGPGPVAHRGWPSQQQDFPWLTNTTEQGAHRLYFPSCGPEPLGFYPIVDSLAWLEKLLPLGVKTIQLRIKNTNGAAEIEAAICKAIELARSYDARLFINDHWQLAIQHRAYGVHLGQDDLHTADLEAISKARLRLGISTHCYEELARTHALRPSYIAYGPVYETHTKQISFAPQGILQLERICKLMSDYPVIAIGGINEEHLPTVLATGADGVAVISAITQADDPIAAAKRWLMFYS